VDKAQHGSMDVVHYDHGMATSIPFGARRINHPSHTTCF
jgi:hypothetical protein